MISLVFFLLLEYLLKKLSINCQDEIYFLQKHFNFNFSIQFGLYNSCYFYVSTHFQDGIANGANLYGFIRCFIEILKKTNVFILRGIRLSFSMQTIALFII